MPHKEKIGTKEKQELVKRCINGELDTSEASRIAGVSYQTVQNWISLYEMDGAEALSPHKQYRIYGPELKQQAVQDYLSGMGSYATICKKYKIRDTHILRDWLKVYNAHGEFNLIKRSGGRSCMKQGRDTTQEERIQIAQECFAAGKNYGEVALKYSVSYQQVRTWTRRYEELGESGLEDRRGKRKKDQEPRTPLEEAQIEIKRLKHELHKAEMERDLLKKLNEVARRDAYRK